MAPKTSLSQRQIIIPTKVIFVCVISSIFFNIPGQDFGVPSRTTVGVGVRAFAMGNNYVALSDDASAMFWNPAGLAFTPVREFQLSLNGFSQNLESEYKDSIGIEKNSSDRQRVRLSNVSLLRSFPTGRGGFSLAFGFQCPYLLDDIIKYSVKYSSGNSMSFDYYSFGQLNLWTAAFGIQIAQDFGVGTAISLITGKNIMKASWKYFSGAGVLYSTYDDEIEQDYLGCDIRLGFLYSLLDRIRFGMRVVLPQFIIFNEEFNEETEDSIFYYTDKGKLKTSSLGAFGVSYRSSFMIISCEVRARSPIPDAEEKSSYAYWRIGAGAGVEIPLFVESLLLRGGYSWQEYDRNPMLIDYDIPPEDFSTDIDVDIVKDEHLFTAGISYLTKNAISFDISYGYRFWELSKWEELFEEHSLHRVVASFAIRY